MIERQEIISKFDCVKSLGRNSYQVRCPVHDDKKASLTITFKHDKALFHCHAGCDTKEILEVAGLTFADIGTTKENKPAPKWKTNLIKEYRYYEPYTKQYLYSSLKYKDGDGKSFKLGKVQGESLTFGVSDSERTLYNVNRIIRAIADGIPVYIVEGEKDADTLNVLGLPATTSGGVNTWKERYADYFRGADVIIYADNDEAGQKFATQIAQSLRGHAFRTKIITPSNISKGDITDHLEQFPKDTRLEEVRRLNSTVQWDYANWVTVTNKGKTKINVGLLAQTISKHNHIIRLKTPGEDNDIVMIYDGGVYKRNSKTDIQQVASAYIPVEIVSPTTLKNVADLVVINAERHDFKDIDSNQDIINFRNGLLNIKTWKFTAHDPRILSTIQLNCDFDMKAKCENWEQFTKRFCCNENDGTLDSEMLNSLQEILGFIISGIYGYRLKQAYFLQSLEGNTGKSVIIRVLSELLGVNNVTSVSLTALCDGSKQFKTSEIFGKRAIFVGDYMSEEIKDCSVFKCITGGDSINMERKHKSPFDYIYTGIVLVGCNRLPTFNNDKGNHMLERMRVLNARNTIAKEERDDNLSTRIIDNELSGVALWCLLGLKRLLNNGLHLSPCHSSDIALEEYRRMSDVIYMFISECCTVDKTDSKLFVKATTLYDNFCRWCVSNGYMTVNKKEFQQRLEGYGLRYVRRNDRGVVGIALGKVSMQQELTL